MQAFRTAHAFASLKQPFRLSRDSRGIGRLTTHVLVVLTGPGFFSSRVPMRVGAADATADYRTATGCFA
jgi:hypothetical protein